jgi:hypothetical protein
MPLSSLVEISDINLFYLMIISKIKQAVAPISATAHKKGDALKRTSPLAFLFR